MRCASPPDSVAERRSSVRYSRPTSFKNLHRLILLSATYRQTSTRDAANAKRDADNRYLWRMNRQRLDAESIQAANNTNFYVGQELIGGSGWR